MENRVRVEQSYEFNKSLERSVQDMQINVQHRENQNFHNYSTNDGLGQVAKRDRSPYRAEVFKMRVLRNRRPRIPKAKAMMDLLSRNRTSKTITKLLANNSKSAERLYRLR